VALTAPDSTGYENVIAVPTARSGINPPNFLAYKPDGSTPSSCVMVAETAVLLPTGAGELTGVSVSQPDGGTATAFGSHGAGFSSVPLNASSFGSSADYAGSSGSSLYAPAAPAIYLDGGAPEPIFGAYASSALDAGTGIVRDADAGMCGVLNNTACWTPGPLNRALDVSHTPLFAGGYGFATDDKGVVQAFPLSGGTALTNAASTAKYVSAPLLLGNAAPPANPLVVVQSDGRVRVLTLSPASDTTVLTVGTFVARPSTPVADARKSGALSGSVIYVIDGGGCTTTPCASWVWALQSDAPPLPASSTSWVRPGRDSCNTRNAQALCQ
jgi:hypothetical protein